VLTTAGLVSWARNHATDLEADMTLQDRGYDGWWWAASSHEAESKIRARATAALCFLERFAGKDSQWTFRAHVAFDENRHSMETGAREVAEILRAWAAQVEAGIVPVRQLDAQGARAVASSDLMEQVRFLIDEKRDVHPAAPIVLAGAALELALRSAIEELDLPLPTKLSIANYTACLRKAEVLSVQDVKDVEQMAGLRNLAAHGHHSSLDADRAELMERGVSKFLLHLAQLVATSTEVNSAALGA
jgi:hypothetical protein